MSGGHPVARVLVVAGSDSGGGAGIQADLKTVMALGGYATTAITALTAQNTLGVSAVLSVPPEFVAAQMRAVLDDIGADAIKIGMLNEAGILAAVAEILDSVPAVPVVLDPVMVAKGGRSLLDPAALDGLKHRLLPLTSVFTPNLPEAEALIGRAIPDAASMAAAARALLDLGPRAVLLKGGHLPGDDLVDVLATGAGIEVFTGRRLPGKDTHGTGCTLASALATGLAQGLPLATAVARARDYLRRAIAAAPGIGRGHGPLGHLVTI